MDRQPSFFRPGGTLEPGAGSYIVRKADEQLLEALIAREYVFLLDSRQKGKSSLIARAILRLKEAGVRPVKLDLQRIGANVTPEQWYAGLAVGIGQELGLQREMLAYWQETQAIGPLARFVGAIQDVVLAQIDEPLVIFIDEIDFVRALDFSTDEFFAAIRECFNRRSSDDSFRWLTFCLVGVATPGQLIRNADVSPFNIGIRIDLTDFTLEETTAYAGKLNGCGRNGEILIRRIHHWTGGHPYITQLLCSQVALHEEVASPQEVDHLVRNLLFSPEARQREPNLADVERRILDPDVPGLPLEERLTQVLELYGRMLRGTTIEATEQNPIVATLRLSGIGVESSGSLRVRNRIYGTVFNDAWRLHNMPEAEVRRQAAATRRATLRTAAVAGLFLLAISAGSVGILKLSGERQRALTDLQARSSDLKKVSDARQIALTALEAKSEDLRRTSAERQTAIERLKTSSQQLKDVSQQRLKALAALGLRNEDLRHVSADRERTITQLNARTAELGRQSYDSVMQSISFGLAADDSKRVTQLADRVRDSRFRAWEWGYVNSLLNEYTYEAQLTTRSYFEVTDNGKLMIATPSDLYEVGPHALKHIRAFAIKVTDEDRKGFLAMQRAFPWNSPRGSSGGYRLWFSWLHRSTAIHDSNTDAVVLPARKDMEIWDIDPKGQYYLGRPAAGLQMTGDGTTITRSTQTTEDIIQLRTIIGNRVTGSIKGRSDLFSLAFLPNGNWLVVLVTADGKGKLCLMDRKCNEIRSSVLTYSYSDISVPNERLFALLQGKKCEVRSVEDLSVVCTLPEHADYINSISFSPDNSQIATACRDGMVRVFDLHTGKLQRKFFAHSSYVMDVAFLPDGTGLASVDSPGNLKVWPNTPVEPYKEYTDVVTHRANYSKSGNELIRCTREGTIISQNLKTGKAVRREMNGYMFTISDSAEFVYAIRPDGRVLALDPSSLQERRSARPFPTDGFVLISVLPGGTRLLASFRSAEQMQKPTQVIDRARKYVLLDANTLDTVGDFETPVWNLVSVGTGRVLKYIAIRGGREREARLYSALDGREVRRFKFDRTAYDLDLSPDGRTLAVSLATYFGSEDAEIRLYDTLTGKDLGKLQYSGTPVFGPKFSPDGKFFAAVGSKALLWNLKTRKIVASFAVGPLVNSLIFSPDSERIISTGAEQAFSTIWDARNGSELFTLPYAQGAQVPGRTEDSISFTSDGRHVLAFCRDGALRIWSGGLKKAQPRVASK